MSQPRTFEKGDLTFTYASSTGLRPRHGSLRIKKQRQDFVIETPSFFLPTKSGTPECLTIDMLTRMEVDALSLNLRDM